MDDIDILGSVPIFVIIGLIMIAVLVGADIYLHITRSEIDINAEVISVDYASQISKIKKTPEVYNGKVIEYEGVIEVKKDLVSEEDYITVLLDDSGEGFDISGGYAEKLVESEGKRVIVRGVLEMKEDDNGDFLTLKIDSAIAEEEDKVSEVGLYVTNCTI
jgi:hypothetical protein